MVNEAVDPYARALTANGGVRGVVVDLDMTDPEGWENDIRPPFGGSDRRDHIRSARTGFHEFS